MVKKKTKKKTKNPWVEHVMKYRKEHPGKPYGECMAEAKKTYRGK